MKVTMVDYADVPLDKLPPELELYLEDLRSL